MKRTLPVSAKTRFILAFAGALVCLSAIDISADDNHDLKDQKAENSYAVGMQMGGKLKDSSLDLDADLVAQGIKDAMTGATTLLNEEEMNAALNSLRAEYKADQKEALQHLAEKNKRDGEAFLAANKVKDGVFTLESGLQYKILRQGEGKKPTADDTVICHYRGSFIDGRQFDSSYGRKKPTTFPLKSVIPGWSEALQLMPAGSKWQLFIPSELAYGKTGQRGRGRGKIIGPNTVLIFEVELLSIQEQRRAAAKAEVDKSGIQVSFKLDPRITRASYLGERWISPPAYTTTEETIEIRAQAVDSKGKPEKRDLRWIPSDPDMVEIMSNEGDVVEIKVKRPGESSLEIDTDGLSKKLSLKAKQLDSAMQVEIAQ